MLSVPRPGLPVAALVAAVLALVPAAAATAAPAPFGHACTPTDGVRFCPTADLGARVPSFDGTPIDVDVTLPAEGEGPFPTILLLHGLGQTKTAFQGGDPGYNATFFAQRGYAVVMPTARGFGNSCGVPASRTAGCEQGWTRLGDIRYEVRDVQHLTGLLVDQGIAKPDAIGSTGVSYGGGFSTMLAFLRDRVRLPDGNYAPWTSPNGTPIRLTAAWPRWLWSNGESIFTRNGRASAWSRTPTGVEAEAYAGGIFAVAFGGFVAPTGGDLSADLLKWKAQLDSGRLDASTQPTLDNAYNFHGAAGVTGATPAPMLLQSGWTDALFPVGQALAAYDAARKQDPSAPVALQLGDLGHSPGANHPKDVAAFDAQGVAFFDAWLKGSGAKPAPGAVTAFGTTCPTEAAAGSGPYTASSYGKLARGALRMGPARRLTISSTGASTRLAAGLNPLTTAGRPCTTHAVDRTSKAIVVRRSPGVTLLGRPVVSGRVTVKGRYGQIAARLWDLNPKTRRQQLVTRGVYRLKDDERGRFALVLDGNGWTFAKGHRIVVELLGRDAPTYGASPTAFRATLSRVGVSLPVRDRPSRKKGIKRP